MSALPPPSLQGDIIFNSLIHHNGLYTLASHLSAIIYVDKDGGASLTYLDNKELPEPIPLVNEGDGIEGVGPVGPTLIKWKSKNTATINIREQTVIVNSVELVQTYFKNLSEKPPGTGNRFGNGWYAEATIVLGAAGEQVFKDAPIIPFSQQQGQ